MKKNITVTKTIIIMLGITFILSSCSSWHYKYPRVRIDSENTTTVTKEEAPNEFVATAQAGTLENNTSQDQVIEDSRLDNRRQENVNDKKSTGKVHQAHVKAKMPFSIFAGPVKKLEDKISHAQGVEKVAMSGWVRIMVILFVIGFILLLIGIFLSIFIYGGFWWLFWTFGALFILAGFIILILGLVGLI